MNELNFFPLHALSRTMCDVIDALAWSPATEILLAGYLDAYVSQAVASCVLVKRPDGTTTSVIAYVMNLGPSGSGKTPMGRHFQSHFDSWVQAYDAVTAEAWQEYGARLDVWKAEKAGVLKTIKKQAASGQAAEDRLQQRLIELEKNPPQVPPSPPRRLENTTLAAWMEQAMRHPATFFYTDEGSAMLANLEKDLVSTFCGYWSEMPPSYARSQMGVQVVRSIPTVVLSIQPRVFMDFLMSPKGRNFLDAGMAGRFVYYVVHESDFAKECRRMPAVHDMTALQTVFDQAEYFFREQDRLNQQGWKSRRVLEMSRSAEREFKDVEAHLQYIRQSATDARELTVIDKAAENVLRHAARHHAFEGIDGPITPSEIANSADLVLWSLGNFARLLEYGQTSARSVDKDADALLDLMYYGLHERGKIAKRKLSEAAFNIGLGRPIHFADALSTLCRKDLATCKDGYIYWDEPDRLGHVISRAGIR